MHRTLRPPNGTLAKLQAGSHAKARRRGSCRARQTPLEEAICNCRDAVAQRLRRGFSPEPAYRRFASFS